MLRRVYNYIIASRQASADRQIAQMMRYEYPHESAEYLKELVKERTQC